MDEQTCTAEVVRLIGEHAASLLTSEDYAAACRLAQVPDSAGRLPGTDGYEPTFEPYWAAAEALTMIAVRSATTPTLAKFSAEGATFERATPDWWAAAAALRDKSPLARAIRSGGLGMIEIEGGAGYDTTARTWPDRRLRRVIGNWS